MNKIIKKWKKFLSEDENEEKNEEKDLFLDEDEDFQQDIKKKHPKMKKKNIGLGGNKKKEPPFVKKPSFKRSKSSPPGYQGV